MRHACVRACACACVHAHVHVYVYAFVHAYVCVYMYTHTLHSHTLAGVGVTTLKLSDLKEPLVCDRTPTSQGSINDILLRLY